ncbi:MAG: hypothetical protein ACI9OJ_002014 [Myxococcota bacterium]|jgi:hypothetical protein
MKSAAKTSPGEPSAPKVTRRSGCGHPVESLVGKLLSEWAAKCEE